MVKFIQIHIKKNELPVASLTLQSAKKKILNGKLFLFQQKRKKSKKSDWESIKFRLHENNAGMENRVVVTFSECLQQYNVLDSETRN